MNNLYDITSNDLVLLSICSILSPLHIAAKILMSLNVLVRIDPTVPNITAVKDMQAKPSPVYLTASSALTAFLYRQRQQRTHVKSF